MENVLNKHKSRFSADTEKTKSDVSQPFYKTVVPHLAGNSTGKETTKDITFHEKAGRSYEETNYRLLPTFADFWICTISFR